MLNDQIKQYIAQAEMSSMSRSGGFLPHTMSSKEITDTDIHYGLQRMCGWNVPVSIIARTRANQA
jgi:hypothetical protein